MKKAVAGPLVKCGSGDRLLLARALEGDSAGLVIRLTRVGIDAPVREKIGLRVMHRKENLPGLDRSSDEHGGGRRAPARADDHAVPRREVEAVCIDRVYLGVDFLRIKFTQHI